MPWWRFWKPETEAEKLAIQQQKDAVAALENGDLPPLAKKRIHEHTVRQDGFFSSDLSVREFLLTEETGIQPISQVMGTAFYNISLSGSYTGWWRNTGELVKTTEAHMHARKLAVDRMKQEAKLLGASGVIGVRIFSRKSYLAPRLTEFTAYGTAVHVPGHPPGQEPFTSDLNGQDFWQLYKAGYRPKELVMGMCCYYISTNFFTNFKANMQTYGFLGLGNWSNQEMEALTKGFNHSRNVAKERLMEQCIASDAHGCVGMSISHTVEQIVVSDSDESKQVDFMINFLAIGTAVTNGQPVARESPLMVIDLSKGKNSGLTVAFD
jgi:uncharacterized protein YbjQ (UPF0145 family)